MTFRTLRILILLTLLSAVAGMTYWESMVVRNWLRPLEVSIYPVNGDGTPEVGKYIAGLKQVDFQEIGHFIASQSERYRGKGLPPVIIRLADEIRTPPPALPEGRRSALFAILWSLSLRYYAFEYTPFWSSLGTVRVFVVYHQGEEGKPLQHSLGLHKGLVGVVHAFAQDRQNAQNNVVITHELFHALGASDKYDSANQPIYPEGFGDRGDGPRYPQHVAGIMAGRIAIRPDEARIPAGLEECVVGYKTAWEINW
ncbi:MAG: hypothetical protein Q7V00_13200 [Sulfurimicrobium sp.]|nr:hypothetical protein [Sulfurimicrobium sp.]MDP1704763.1 hypothetical protein [Sulfurimicrobium sp.]MDP2199334.1 hypothetical protein [Sulfurimicrobium sp.]MDP3686596.1 hypothetical protein [Sulfurimicrobium sp.]